MEAKDQQNQIFTDSQIQNFAGFYNALKKVHNRLIKEGYLVKNKQILPPIQLNYLENHNN